MRRIVAALTLTTIVCTTWAQDPSVVTRPSKYSVPETTAKLVAAIESSGVYKIFYQLDHAANAEREGAAKLLPSQLILFGNPKVVHLLLRTRRLSRSIFQTVRSFGKTQRARSRLRTTRWPRRSLAMV